MSPRKKKPAGESAPLESAPLESVPADSAPAESAPAVVTGGAPREIRMEFRHLVLDPGNQSPIVILVNDAENAALPIWVDPFQASTIVTVLEGIEFPRPLTHDLLLDVVGSLGGDLERVVIHDLRDSTFIARLEVRVESGQLIEIDSRPSDAIVLAVKTDIPIFANSAICDPVSKVEQYLEDAQSEQYKQLLASMDPAEISKYKM